MPPGGSHPRVRAKIPDCGITTDVMVGFPGETDRHFEHTLKFVTEMQFSGLHVFKYSPRRGTPAADFPDQVIPAAKEARSRQLIELGREMTGRFAAMYLGKTVDVLAEQFIFADSGGQLEGLTDNYLRAYCFTFTRRTQIYTPARFWNPYLFNSRPVAGPCFELRLLPFTPNRPWFIGWLGIKFKFRLPTGFRLGFHRPFSG